MHRQQGRGDRGTKANDRVLTKPGTFRKSKRRSSFAKRVHLISNAIKRYALFDLLHT